jgi:anti-anti-sigma regulatory factor
VHTALTAALAQTPGDLVIDLSGVGFCCVRGLELLVDNAHTARQAGIGYALSGLSVHLDRVLTLVWPEEHFERYRAQS